jgi:thiamine pyrophosphate-dependent acetolactate synthase large subunit-like protein
MAEVVTKHDLLTTLIGQTWDDWWNHKPADNTFFTGILGSVTTTALGLAVSLPHRRIIAIESDGSVRLNTGVMCTLGKERPPNLTVVGTTASTKTSAGRRRPLRSTPTSPRWRRAPGASIASQFGRQTSSTASSATCSMTVR